MNARHAIIPLLTAAAFCPSFAVHAQQTAGSIILPPTQNVPIGARNQPLRYQCHTVEVPEAQTSLACVAGDTLDLSGSFDNEDYDAVMLQVDHRYVQTVPLNAAGANTPYSFSWRPDSPGMYRVRVVLEKSHGGFVVYRTMGLHVCTGAPMQFMPVPASAVNDMPITFVSTAGEFTPAKMSLTCNNAAVDGATMTAATLPTGSLPPGTYPVKFQAWDSDGALFDGPTVSITVPERSHLSGAMSYTIVKPTDKTPLSITLADDVKPSVVSYILDGQKVAQATSAPFPGSADLSGFPSGQHTLSADVSFPNGSHFLSPAASFLLVNGPDDARIAKAAKEEADRQAAIEVAKQQTEQAEARERAAEQIRLAAVEASKDKGPMGPARKILRQYFDDHTNLGYSLVDVKDVRKSDSEIYPSDVYAIVGSSAGQQQIVFGVNYATGEVSDLVKSW